MPYGLQAHSDVIVVRAISQVETDRRTLIVTTSLMKINLKTTEMKSSCTVDNV